MIRYEIEHAANGWICNYIDPEDGQKVVGDEREDEVESFIDFLYSITEHFGPTSGRHDEKRIRIIRLPGDKHEGKLDKKYLDDLKDLHETLGYIVKKYSKNPKKQQT